MRQICTLPNRNHFTIPSIPHTTTPSNAIQPNLNTALSSESDGRLYTASILALIVNCSFLFPSLLICRKASTPYPSKLCNSKFPAQYSAYTLLNGNPIPSLRFGGREESVEREESW